MKTFNIIFSTALAALTLASCNLKEEKIVLQTFNTPGDEASLTEADRVYYDNLRTWKESKHTVSYVFFAKWAPPEGSTSLYIEYKAMKPRLISLPDSLDFVNLWMGCPMKDESTIWCEWGDIKDPETGEIKRGPQTTYDYSPYAYADLEFCQKYKGTKFIAHADASHYGQQFTIPDPETGEMVDWTVDGNNRESIEAFATMWCNRVISHGLDGIDWDYEGWGQNQILWAVQKCAEYFGPKAAEWKAANPDGHESYPEKYLIVDYFGSAPGKAIEPYINYLVKQAYSAQGSSVGGPSWCPAEKMIYCEQYEQSSSDGYNFLNGGYPTGQKNEDGEDMYTLEYYARYSNTNGHGQGGFGAYYIDNDYDNGVEALKKKNYKDCNYEHYGFLRRAIQIVNPAGAYTPGEDAE